MRVGMGRLRVSRATEGSCSQAGDGKLYQSENCLLPDGTSGPRSILLRNCRRKAIYFVGTLARSKSKTRVDVDNQAGHLGISY